MLEDQWLLRGYWTSGAGFLEGFWINWGLSGGSDGQESACNSEDVGSIPGLGGSPGEGNGNPLQYSFLENPHGQRSLVGYSPWGHTELDTTEWLSTAHTGLGQGEGEGKSLFGGFTRNLALLLLKLWKLKDDCPVVILWIFLRSFLWGSHLQFHGMDNASVFDQNSSVFDGLKPSLFLLMSSDLWQETLLGRFLCRYPIPGSSLGTAHGKHKSLTCCWSNFSMETGTSPASFLSF